MEDADDDRVSYAVFGARFFEHAVSEERILGAVSPLAGDRINFGPIGVGPGKLARVTAKGEVGEASIAPVEDEYVSFALTIPVQLDLLIDLGVDQHAFDVELDVELRLTARAAAPLRVVIDIEPPTRRDVTVRVEPGSLRASVLQRVAGVDDELRRFVARYVAREIDKPHIRSARDIDVAERIDRAWGAGR